MTFKRRFLWLLSLTVSIAPLNAAELSLELGLRSLYDDNARRAPANFPDSNRQEEFEQIGSMLAEIASDNSWHELTAAYTLSYHDDVKDTQRGASNTRFEGFSELDLILHERFLAWHADHRIQQKLANKQSADIARNLQIKEIYGTGPKITLPFSKTQKVDIELEWSKTEFSTVDESAIELDRPNSTQKNASLIYTNRLSNISSWVTGLTASESEFDSDSPNIEFYQAYVGYQSLIAGGYYYLNIGYNETRIDQDDDSINQQGTLVQAYAEKSTQAHTLSASFIQQLTDSNAGLQRGLPEFREIANNNYEETDVVLRRYAQISYLNKNVCSRCEAGLNLTYDYQDYRNIQLDENEFRQGVIFRYAISRNVRFFANGGWGENVTDRNNRETKERFDNYSTGIEWQMAPTLRSKFEADYRDRRSDRGELTYDRTRIELSIFWEAL